MQAISYQAFKNFYEYSDEKLRYRDILALWSVGSMYVRWVSVVEFHDGAL